MGGFQAAASPFGAAPAPAPPDSLNPYQSPTGLGPEPQFFASPGEIRPTPLDFSATFSRTWTVFVDRWLYVFGAKILLMVITFIIFGVIQVAQIGLGAVVQNGPIVFACTLLSQVVGNVVQVWLNIGMILFLLGVVRGEEPRFGLIFAGGPFLLSIILCIILLGLLTLGPAGLAAGLLYLGGVPPWVNLTAFLIILLVPGIIPFTFMFLQAPVLIIDRNMGVIDALSTSRQVMAGNKLTLFLIHLVALLVAIFVGLLTCLIGLAVYSYIYAPILYIVIYLSVTGQPTMADRYAMPSEQPGGSPFGQASPPGSSPFA